LWTFQRTFNVNYPEERPTSLLSRREDTNSNKKEKSTVAIHTRNMVCLRYIIVNILHTGNNNNNNNNRLPRTMKHYFPTGRRNYGRPLKRLLDT
jgi:hypothetical protein